MADLLINGGRIVRPDGIADASIAIESGKIVRISKKASAPKADNVLDVKGCYILPGIIDPHVHFREPGNIRKEGWRTGSMAAAAGGVTTVLDMPNNKPPTTTVRRLNDKRGLAEEKSTVDFGFHFGSVGDNISEIIKADRVASTKVYMGDTTGGLTVRDDTILGQIFESSRLISVHAEGRMIRKAAEIAKSKGKRLYICHVSSKDEADTLKELKKDNVYAEVTPHHLFLDSSDLKRLGSLGLMKPELKTKTDRIALWECLRQGLIGTVGSDHAPHLLEEKDGDRPPYGVPGVETSLPLMLNAVNRRMITLELLARIMSENPAGIFNIAGKGRIAEGFDADLAIVDLSVEKTIKDDSLFTRCGWSPYSGMKVKGWPVKTYLRGKLIFDDGIPIKVKGEGINYGSV
ncbi:MAG: amidohydrolase family protein [Candidatus Altiarchaeota archaeon]